MPIEVWVLGFVSLLMDVSSEMIHSLLPVFMVSALGAGTLAVGLVEGLAEATALVIKVFSGALSDRLRKRKALVLAGYSLSALSKPLFAVAGGVSSVLAARLIDRTGKGVREAPRDALIADVTPAGSHGAAYGLRQALDTVGAFLGPLIAVYLMVRWTGAFRKVFWCAAAPAAACVALLAFGVREPARRETGIAPPPFDWGSVSGLGPAFWRVVLLGAVFGLARFSEAFLILRARDRGLPDAWTPMVLVLMNIVYSAVAYPAGVLSDRMSRRGLLAAGLVFLIAADGALAGARGLPLAALGVCLWGVHLGLSQGILSAMVAGSAPADLRGTAFGVYNIASGAAALAAGVLAGWLWTRWGPSAAFVMSSVMAGLSLALL